MFPDPSLHSTYSARLFLRRPCTAKAARITTERCKKPVAAKSGIEAGTSSCRATDCHRSVRSYHLPASAQPLGFFLIWPSLLGNPGFLLRRGLSSRRPNLIQRILQPFLGHGRFATHPWSDSKEKGSENMAAATSASTMSLLPISQLKQQHRAAGALVAIRRPRDPRRRRYVVTTARLFGPAIFEASKLKVLFLGKDEAAPPENKPPPPPLPRTYTLTHSDVTASLTLAVSHTVNRAQLQGWYNRLQRDEVVAEWKKVRGRMSLHVHCHISGGHFLLDLIAGLRYYIFRKELPVVLQAFVHGDVDLFSRHPELEEATVWVYFHSNLPRFNRVECWGPLRDAAAPAEDAEEGQQNDRLAACEWPRRCPQQCECCFPPHSLIPWPNEHDMADAPATGQTQQ